MQPKVILLVEDNPDDVRLTRRALKVNGISNELVVANDGAAALDYLATAAASRDGVLPTVTLLDLDLPKIDGLEFLRRVRADAGLRRLPIVVLTSSNEAQDVIKSYDLGANSYIQKPVDFEQFTAAVRQMGIYWLRLNEPPPRPDAYAP
ncbi:MAG TPA: response regulator [Opitutaceae bacterium]